jgi:hypothetical protein
MFGDAVKFSIQAKDSTAATFAKVRSKVESLNKAAIGLGATIAGALGVAAFGTMAKNAMSTADRIHKLTLRIGASAEALSQYRHAADLSGISFEEFASGLEKMSRNVSEAMQGTGTAQDALKELGIEVIELSQLKPEGMFEVLADAIAKVESPTERTRIAMDIFGRSGGALLQMMEGGAAGLQSMRQEADALGMTLDKNMVTKVAEANDAITKVTSRITALTEKLMVYLAPVILDIADNFGAWIDQNRILIGQNMQSTIEGLIAAARGAIPVFTTIWNIFEALGKAIGWVAFKVWELSEKLSQVNFGGFDWMGGLDLAGMEPATETGPAVGSAAWVAQQKGGINPHAGTGGTTVVNNFNTQLTRSDAVAIAAESDRHSNRQ